MVNRHEALVACETIGGYLAEPKEPEQAKYLVRIFLLQQDRLKYLNPEESC